MKIFLQHLIPAILPAVILSCATTQAKTETTSKSGDEPEYNLDSTKVMDENWALYYSTKDEKYLENIIAYTDTEDLLTKTINKERNRLSSDEKFMNILKSFGAQVSDEAIEFPGDFEMLSAFFIELDEETRENIKYIYSYFPQELFIRGVEKSTAFWSIVSNAEQNKTINIAVQKHIPYMKPKVQETYYDYMGLKNKIDFIKSDNGAAPLQLGNIWINVILVNELNEVINRWNSLKPEEEPYITGSAKVDKVNNSIGPFIVYHCDEQMEDFPLYYDCELILPDGTTGDKKTKLKFADKKPEGNLLYSVLQHYGWTFDQTDPNGKYKVRVTVYSENKVISVFELDFTVKM